MSDPFKNFNVGATPTATTQQATNTEKPSVTVEQVIPAKAVNNPDTFENTTTKKVKKGPIKTVKGFIANVKKFFTTTGTYIGGTAKGIGQGAVAGSLVYTVGSIINHVRGKAALKAGKEIKNIPNKFLAVAVAGLTIASNIWNASLDATQKQSEIDHRWTGH
ncbi:MAG: hypothetical protein E7Z90_05120 [Cyanobacteria bacterium SIG29]|nr:hypothetical protein [Cyanobacteria bacterium SIG29]